jgi:hypothetical protein
VTCTFFGNGEVNVILLIGSMDSMEGPDSWNIIVISFHKYTFGNYICS